MDRVSVAKQRLDQHRRVLRTADVLCIDCDYLAGPSCRHPAVQSVNVDPVTGAVRTIDGRAAEARLSDGLCGPEAELFEPKAPAKVALASFGRGLGLTVQGLAWVGVIAGLLAILYSIVQVV